MLISIKKGVSLVGIKPELNFLWICTLECIRSIDPDCAVKVTSVIRKKKGKVSFHPVGFALDFVISWSAGSMDITLENLIHRQIGSHSDYIFHKNSKGKGFHGHLEVDEH